MRKNQPLTLLVDFLLVATVIAVEPPAQIVPPALISTLTESARDLPVAYDVDVVVVGGSSGAVAAALAAEHKAWQESLLRAKPVLERIAKYGTRKAHVEKAKRLLAALSTGT